MPKADFLTKQDPDRATPMPAPFPSPGSWATITASYDDPDVSGNVGGGSAETAVAALGHFTEQPAHPANKQDRISALNDDQVPALIGGPPSAAPLSGRAQENAGGSVTEADVPATPSGFARFAVTAGLLHDGLRSLARALGLGVDCGRSRGVENIALDLLRAATQSGVAAQLPSLVVRELTTGAVSSADTLLHPQQVATLDEVPVALVPLRAWSSDRLSEEELAICASFAGLSASNAGSSELRAQRLIIDANRHSDLAQVRHALLEVYNMKVREAAPPIAGGANLDGDPVALVGALFDACTLETLHAIAIHAGAGPQMVGASDRRLLFANALVRYHEQRGTLDTLRLAARAVLPRHASAAERREP